MHVYVRFKNNTYSRIFLHYSIHCSDIALKECDPLVVPALGETLLPHLQVLWGQYSVWAQILGSRVIMGFLLTI